MGGFVSRQQEEDNLDVRVSREIRILQLENEIKALKADNNELRRQMMNQYRGANRSAGEPARPVSVVSPDRVEELVDAMLADPMTNLGFVPDFMERPLEKRALIYVLKALARTIDTSRIELAGHEILMHMRPIERQPIDIETACPPADGYSDYDERDIPEESLRSDSGFDANKVLL